MTRTLVAFALMLSATLAASPSFASRNDLINDALNKNLEERDQVTGTYHQNDAAERPVLVEKRTKKHRIPVVMDSELMGSVSHNLRDYDNPSRTYKEKHVEARLDREVKDVDHAYDKQNAQDPQRSSVRALLDVEG